MTDTSQLEQLLKFLLETLQEGKAFTIDQSPAFVRELLLWRFYESMFLAGLGVFFAVASLVVFRLIRRHVNDPEPMDWFVLLLGVPLSLIMTFVNVRNMIQVSVAPRLVLVQMVRELLK